MGACTIMKLFLTKEVREKLLNIEGKILVHNIYSRLLLSKMSTWRLRRESVFAYRSKVHLGFALFLPSTWPKYSPFLERRVCAREGSRCTRGNSFHDRRNRQGKDISSLRHHFSYLMKKSKKCDVDLHTEIVFFHENFFQLKRPYSLNVRIEVKKRPQHSLSLTPNQSRWSIFNPVASVRVPINTPESPLIF